MKCRILGSFAGDFPFFKRRCYIVADNGTKYGLYPSGSIYGGSLGVPEKDHPLDIGGQSFKCPASDCDQNECLEKAHKEYPVGIYSILGPNSNTYAGTLARSCCEGGVPKGVCDSYAPGINDNPPKPFTSPM